MQDLWIAGITFISAVDTFNERTTEMEATTFLMTSNIEGSIKNNPRLSADTVESIRKTLSSFNIKNNWKWQHSDGGGKVRDVIYLH